MNPPEAFAQLLAPVALGPITVPNRVVFAAHQTNFAEEHAYSARHVAYYAERARGGAGLIVLEGLCVHPSDYPYARALFGYQPAIVDSLRAVAEAVRAHGAQVVAQLTHAGGQASGNLAQAPVWAPSTVPDVATREVPKAMEPEDIAAVTAGFAQAARYAREAGLDGVEINVADTSLLRQFLSGLTNYRGDAYGGSLENRLRFTLEVIAAVRAALGRDLALGVRLCIDELAPWAGITPEHAREIAAKLAATGRIDYLATGVGSIYTPFMHHPPMHIPMGHSLPIVAQVKAAVGDLPVFAGGRIHDPALAERALAEGQTDLVEMTRALISDPFLVAKVRDGRPDDVRPCIACNQDCQVASPMNPRLSCVHNPAAGYERQWGEGTLPKLARRKRVLVVGGGPAGLEAARVAALRGHTVTVYERASEVGGAPALAARAPQRDPLRWVTDYLVRQLARLEVPIRTGVEVTPELVAREAPDSVVVATGAKPGALFEVEGQDLPHVVDVRQVLAGEATVGERVVLIDEAGSQAAATTAEFLADQGKQVTIVSEDWFVGRDLVAPGDLSPWLQRVLAKGVELLPTTRVERITPETVEVADIWGGEQRCLPADTVVMACWPRPDQGLYFELKARADVELHRAGDALAPRRISQAVMEGHKIGRAI